MSPSLGLAAARVRLIHVRNNGGVMSERVDAQGAERVDLDDLPGAARVGASGALATVIAMAAG